VVGLNTSIVPPPTRWYVARTFAANAHEVFGPTESSPPQEERPEDGGDGCAGVGVADPVGACATFACGCGLLLDCRVTETLVEPGAWPAALPMTSILVFPPCRLAVPVKTPFPTAAGFPCTCTLAFDGETVPRTVTLSAAMTAPFVGESTVTATVPEAFVATVLVVVVVVEPQPSTAIADPTTAPKLASLMSPPKFRRNRWSPSVAVSQREHIARASWPHDPRWKTRHNPQRPRGSAGRPACRRG
jgi:hypothetical protein